MDNESREMLQKILNRLDKMDTRLDKMDSRLDVMEVRQNKVSDQLTELQLHIFAPEGCGERG